MDTGGDPLAEVGEPAMLLERFGNMPEMRLHHHPMDVALVPMWTAICAEAMARMIGAGHGDRFGTCEAPDCDRVYFDLSKNASRRFCSTTCQNRVKAAAFRLRQSGDTRASSHRSKPKRSARVPSNR